MKESFILHTDTWSVIRKLDMEQRGRLFSAVMLYQIGKALPDLDPVTDMAFSFIAAQMDRDNERYTQTVEKRRAAAEARWQHNNANASKSMQNMQKHAKDGDTDNDTGTVTDTVTDTETVTDTVFHNNIVVGRASARTTTKTTAPREIFKKPTVEEVKMYCQERNNNVDPEGFVDYYEANGWKVGRSPMKDWKAAVRTWERKEAGRKKGGKTLSELAAEAVAEAEKEKQDNDEWWS